MRLKKPHRSPSSARHDAAGIEQLRRAAVTNDARQQGTGAHIAASEADAGEQKSGFSLRSAETDIAEQRDHGACTDADTVNCSDYRLRTGAHRLYELAGHTRKFEKSLHVAA